jgi:hypothetical protein
MPVPTAVALFEGADVARVFVVVEYFVRVSHFDAPILIQQGVLVNGSPLDRIDIDAFFEHVPQRRQFAQLVTFDFISSRRSRCLLGGEAADGERIELCASSSLRPRARST